MSWDKNQADKAQLKMKFDRSQAELELAKKQLHELSLLVEQLQQELAVALKGIEELRKML